MDISDKECDFQSNPTSMEISQLFFTHGMFQI